MDITQLGIKTGYLNAKLDKDIYTTIPIRDINYGKGYWLLNKALYSLKQSGRQWNKTISIFLTKNDFIQSKSEEYIFFKKINNELFTFISLYVDDIMITGKCKEVNDMIKLRKFLKYPNADLLTFILGVKDEK